MRALLTALLLTIPLPAAAEWVKVGESDHTIYYLDPATIHRDGALRKVWALYNLKRQDADGAWSSRSLHLYDCNGAQARILSGSGHSQPFAVGKTVWSGRNSDAFWSYIRAGTPNAINLKFVCAR